MKVIEQWYKPISVWLLAAANIIAGAAAYLPEVQQALPADWYRYALMAIFVSRLVKQGSKNDPADRP